MYLQEIVISPDIFEKLSTDIKLDHASYIKNLKLKKILWDKDEYGDSKLEIKLNEILKQCSFPFDGLIKDILDIFKKDKSEYKTINEPVNYSKNEIINILLNLSLKSDSKIINSEDKSPMNLITDKPELSQIEVLNFEEFIDPPSTSKIYSFKRTIKIPQGEEFPFENILRSYLINSEKMIVNDRYLRNRRRGFMVLVKLLKLSSKLSSVIIHTIDRDDNKNDNFDMTTNEFITDLEGIFPDINFEIKKTDNKLGKNRFIKTEYFELEFSPGLDFVNEYNFADKNPVKIDISCLLNETDKS